MGPAGDTPEDALRPDSGAVPADGELLRRIANQDVEAFEILYRRYARSVYGVALHRLSDRERAEDATCRAFAAIRHSAATYVPERGAGARWLFTTAWDAITERARAPAAAESVSEDGWLTFRVHAAVTGLPEHERVPLELAYWGGRSQSEIADLLDLPLGTVETRTRSALARLARRLDDVDDRERA